MLRAHSCQPSVQEQVAVCVEEIEEEPHIFQFEPGPETNRAMVEIIYASPGGAEQQR